jgi:hypothetical protein
MLVLQLRESRERIARYEREMQVRGAISLDTGVLERLDAALKIKRNPVSSRQRRRPSLKMSAGDHTVITITA